MRDHKVAELLECKPAARAPADVGPLWADPKPATLFERDRPVRLRAVQHEVFGFEKFHTNAV
jgi:hypothetical protein